MYTLLFSILFLLVGLTMGFIANDVYAEINLNNSHEFDKLFKENPHPEIFNEDGSVNREDYIAINFELGYDPEDFDPEDIHLN